MAKKLGLLVMAVAGVLAVGAMPATASASPQMFEGPSPLPAGATILATSTNVVATNTALGDLECTSISMDAELLKNSEAEVEAKGTAGEAKGCKETIGSESGPMTITAPQVLSLQTTGGDEGTLALSFIADSGPFECPYEGEGAFTYATGSDVLHVAGIELESAFEFCRPEAGVSLFEGDFTLETEDGTPVTIPPEPGPSPQLREAGVPLVKGATILATSTNAIITNTSLGDLECATLSSSAELLKNSEAEIEAKGTAAETEGCKWTFGSESGPMTVTEPLLFSLQTTGVDEGTLALSFIVDVGPFECVYEGEDAFTYATGTDVLHVAGFEIDSPFEFCRPEAGASLFEGDFTLETEDGTPVRTS